MTSSAFRSASELGMGSGTQTLTEKRAGQTKVGKMSLPRQSLNTLDDRPVQGGNISDESSFRKTQEYPRKRWHKARWKEDSQSFTNTFGSFRLRSKLLRVGPTSLESVSDSPEDAYEHEISITLHPSWWLLRCGISWGINAALLSSSHGWKINLNSFRAVPDDALIFSFCERGNINGVRDLLSSKEASPFDTNSKGWTPLYVSAISYLPLWHGTVISKTLRSRY